MPELALLSTIFAKRVNQLLEPISGIGLRRPIDYSNCWEMV